MGEPILITRHRDRPESLDFAPNGAGRNLSRAASRRTHTPERPARIDARFFRGRLDLFELPGACKDAESVRAEIVNDGLARIVDSVGPYGSIMAGDREADAPWRMKKAREDERPTSTDAMEP